MTKSKGHRNNRKEAGTRGRVSSVILLLSRLSRVLIVILVFLIPFVVYLYTLSPSIVPGDSTEMVTAAIVLGVPHQPSYPVNTLLGHFASKLSVPLGVVARVNAVSAFLQALTVVVFYFLVLELFKAHTESTQDRQEIDRTTQEDSSVLQRFSRSSGVLLIAFTASMYLAFSLVFWQYATKFEVFPLNNLLAVVLLLLAVRISNKAHRRNGMGTRLREATARQAGLHGNNILRFPATIQLVPRASLLLLSFLAGFAFTHHQTILFVFPAVLFLLWRRIYALLSTRQGLTLSIGSFLAGMVPFFGLLLWIASKKPLLNWGEVTGLKGALAALTRRDFGTFSSFLVGTDPVARQAPIEQIWFYLANLVFDFSIVGAVFVGLGVWYLWKRQRRLFWFVSLGSIMSGFVFLMYANFPLGDSFNQATVRRFHMLPNIFVAMFLAFGLYASFLELQEIRARKLEYRVGVFLGRLFLVFVFLFPMLMNFSKANNRENVLTEVYARQAYAQTPENALIMLSGDIPNMTVDYFRGVELGGQDNRITFSPGQFHLPWFTPKLKGEHPELVIPAPNPGKRFTTTTQVIEANWGKWPIYVGPDLVVHDPELEEKFVLYPKQLLFLVKAKGEDLKLEEWRTENDALWEGIDLELIRSVRKRSPMFEETVVFHYARHFFNVGFVYEDVGLNEDAIREYERVLEIDPFFKEALAALGRVYGEKMDPPDYFKAIDYMQKYQSVLKKSEEEYGYAAQGKIYEYQEKFEESTRE